LILRRAWHGEKPKKLGKNCVETSGADKKDATKGVEESSFAAGLSTKWGGGSRKGLVTGVTEEMLLTNGAGAKSFEGVAGTDRYIRGRGTGKS